jgi:hypothetical protein
MKVFLEEVVGFSFCRSPASVFVGRNKDEIDTIARFLLRSTISV